MKFCVINHYSDEGAVQTVSTGISAIGQSLCFGGNEVEHRGILGVSEDLDWWKENLKDQSYDAVIITSAYVKRCYEIVKVFKDANPNIHLVVFADGVYGRLDWDAVPEKKPILYDILNNYADIILTNSYDNMSYYKEWFGNKVICPGFPVNIESIKKFYNFGYSVAKRKDKVWAGYWCYRPHHDILVILKLLQNLGLNSIVAGLGMTEYASQYQNIFKGLELNNVELVKATTPREYLIKILSQCNLATYFTTRASLGRTAAECAVVGIPCIGVRDFFQQVLWKELSMKYVYLEDIKYLIAELQGNTTFRMEVCDRAYDRVQEFEPEIFAKRLIPALMEN